MRIVVGGASGYVGQALVPALRASGHEVLRLVRGPAREGDAVAWDPGRGLVDVEGLAGVEAGVVLNGANIGTRRWTASYKRTLLRSRVDPVHTLAGAFATLDPLPRVLVSQSASGFYGDAGPDPVDESAPAGSGFVSRMVAEWEAAADPARKAGVRVVHPRPHLVLGPGGLDTAAGRLAAVVRFGLGGRLGSGRQLWTPVSLADHVRVLEHLLTAESLEGPVNVAGPDPLPSADVVRAFGRTLHRPTPWVVPGPALRLVLGEFAGELLASQGLDAARLRGSGFTPRHADVDAVVAYACGRG